MWKKILLFTLAITFSITIGLLRFISAAHSLDQIIFSWLLGAWLAITYFTLVRDHVHKHITDLSTG